MDIPEYLKTRNRKKVKNNSISFERVLLVKHHTVNFQTVDFLDVTFNLDKNVYKPFRKENNKPNINAHSNQPRSTLRQLPKSLKNKYPKLHLTRLYLTNRLKHTRTL